MTEESAEPGRADFEERLQEVTRKHRGRRQPSSPEVDEDTLSLSAAAREEVFASPPRPPGRRGESSLAWVAMGLGGGALLAALLLGGWLYQQDDRLDRAQESLILLEEQLENSAGMGEAADLRAEIAQLNARLNELDTRMAQLATESREDPALKADIDRLSGTLSAIGPRLALLERRVEELKGRSGHVASASGKTTKPQGAAAAKGWYVVLASLGGRAAAEKLQRRYRKQGVQVGIHGVTVKGQPRYRLRAGPLPNREAAVRRAAELKKKLGLASVWLSR